jgi:hypothetical protein
MSRPLRSDEPGMCHHVGNHAVDGLAAFQNDIDFRHFFSLLGDQVGLGRLVVHAFVVLPNHFHLLVTSPNGELSDALHDIEGKYARAFNEHRERRGPVFRRRYWSNPALAQTYRRHLVTYFDANPVKAGLATSAFDYPYGSARCFVRGGGPPWLDREWVESAACEIVGADRFDAAVYSRAFGRKPGSDEAFRVVERRIRGGSPCDDPLEDVVRLGQTFTHDWLRKSAARPRAPRISLASENCLERALALSPLDAESSEPATLRVGLLRDVCALTFTEIVARIGRPRTTIQDLYGRHGRAMHGNHTYGYWAAVIAREAILLTFDPASGAWHH